MPVRYGAARKSLIAGNDPVAGNPEYAVAVGLLLEGTKNCASYVVPEAPPIPESEEKEAQPIAEPIKAPKKQKSGGLFGGWTKKIDNMTKTLFDEEESK